MKNLRQRTVSGWHFSFDRPCPGSKFWNNDSLMDVGTENLQVSIFGGGDGSLQDVLRALTLRNQPLELLAFLERDPTTKAALLRASPGLLDVERQSRQLGTLDAKRTTNTQPSTRLPTTGQGACEAVARGISQGIAFGSGKAHSSCAESTSTRPI